MNCEQQINQRMSATTSATGTIRPKVCVFLILQVLYPLIHGWGAEGLSASGGSRLAPQAYVKASNTDAYDSFGRSIAVSGDTMVVGAIGESSDATSINGSQKNNDSKDSGAGYVFVRQGTNWTQQAYLKASNSRPGILFGFSVGVSGDTVVVGAYRESGDSKGANGNQNNQNSHESGAAYVFVRQGTNWNQQAYLKASNTTADQNFGYSVGVSGDTIVVGAAGESSNSEGVNGKQDDKSAENAGAAYIFVRQGTNWSQQAYLKPSHTEAHASFGDAVAISGDTVVAGAWGESRKAGAAYLFVRQGQTWRQQARLTPSDDSSRKTVEPLGDILGSGNFGSSVALDGDTLAVGSPVEATASGAAYVFNRSQGNWIKQARLVSASPSSLASKFGASVAVSGGVVAVGADGESSVAFNAGAAYVFVRSGKTWQQARLKPFSAASGQHFGEAVAVSSGTVVIGAGGDNGNAAGVNPKENDMSSPGSGAVYVFDVISSR